MDEPHPQPNSAMSPEAIRARKEKYRHKIFIFALQLIGIFGGPALFAVLLGKYLDQRFQTGRDWQLILLAVTFVSSWIYVIYRYRQYERERKELNEVNSPLPPTQKND